MSTNHDTEVTQATADHVDVDDLAAADATPTVPELDPEAALLCALLHTTDTAETAHICEHLSETDFLNPRYSQLFQVIADLAAANEPHHAPQRFPPSPEPAKWPAITASSWPTPSKSLHSSALPPSD